MQKLIKISQFVSYRLYSTSRSMQPELFIPSYLKNTYQFQLPTRILRIQDNKLLFADTIFHPQGGGQPKDKGWITMNQQNQNKKIDIVNAAADKGTGQVLSEQIWNQVSSVQGLKEGDEVTIFVDPDVRKKHAKLHSAGHLIDLAVQNLGYGWQTAKGYHFDDGPYVQYKAPFQGLQQKQAALNSQLIKILSQNIITVKEHYSYSEAVQKKLIPAQFKTPLIRIIKFGANSCPCGGTHIENTNEIKKLEITKLAKKGKFLRANYVVQ